MNKYDPNEVFINSFGRRIKNTGKKVDFDPSVTHCALLDNCFCTTNNDCGVNQMCTSVGDYTYRVCQTKNEVPLNFFPKFILPNSTGVFEFLATQTVTLATALLSKCSAESLINALGDTAGNSFGSFLSGLAGEVENGISSISDIGGEIFGIKNNKNRN